MDGIWTMTRPLSSRDPERYWLHPMLKVVRRSDTEIRRLLEKAAFAAESDIERLAPKQPTRRGQLTSAFEALRKTMRNLFDDVGETVQAGRTDAANAAMLSAFEWEEPLYKAAGLSKSEREVMRAATEEMSDRNVELMLRRFNTEQIPLSRQVYRTKSLAQGWVDKLINIGIGRGLSARELAKTVKDHIRPGVRGGTSYAAMRLARTEINNSFHTASILSIQDKPWVSGMSWHLSGSHPGPDICDLLASQDLHDLGGGVYPSGEVPRKPHPHCFCYTVPTLPDEDDFVAAFARGEYDESLPGAEEILVVEPEPEVIKVTRVEDRIEQKIKEEPADVFRLGGMSARTDLVTFADGTKLVHKSPGNRMGLDDEEKVYTIDAEVLGARMLAAFGLRAAGIHRSGPDEVWMEYIDGELGGEIKDERQRRLLGYVDHLMIQFDRNEGNWIIDKDGNVVGIDNGEAWTAGYTTHMKSTSEFAQYLYEENDIDISPSDIREGNRRLEELRPVFAELNRLDWLEASLARNNALLSRRTRANAKRMLS